jgi:putative DNA primase/helicase
MRHKYPQADLIIAGDNDQFNKINIGILKASFAAEYVQGRMVLPRFKDLSSKPTDFNDLHCLEGLDTVSHQIMEVCDER